jgi:hypothetical protein
VNVDVSGASMDVGAGMVAPVVLGANMAQVLSQMADLQRSVTAMGGGRHGGGRFHGLWKSI